MEEIESDICPLNVQIVWINLIVAQLIEKFPTIYANRGFITTGRWSVSVPHVYSAQPHAMFLKDTPAPAHVPSLSFAWRGPL
jgi:hypothetical protein